MFSTYMRIFFCPFFYFLFIYFFHVNARTHTVDLFTSSHELSGEVYLESSTFG